jgi:hypothetical protein
MNADRYKTKVPFQVLLDKAKAGVVVEMARVNGVSSMEVIRALVYKGLRELLPREYESAEARDSVLNSDNVKGPKTPRLKL